MQPWNRLYLLFSAGTLALSAALIVSIAPAHSEALPQEANPDEPPPASILPAISVNEDPATPTACPRGQGYWRTHSAHGPAPYDETWAQIGAEAENGNTENGDTENGEGDGNGAGGADTEFYGSGQSYYEVLWTPPRGNAYYILAYKTIAAELNLLVTDGEASEAYLALYAEATALFEEYGPDTPALSPPGHQHDGEENGDENNGDTEGLRTQFIQLAGALAAEMEASAEANGCPPVEDDSNGEEPNGEEENTEENNGEEGNTEENNGEEENNEENTADASGAVAGPTEPDTLAPALGLFIPTLSRD